MQIPMQIPTIINHKYNIIEKIGNGEFGAVYRGRNIRTDEMVAVKVEPVSHGLKLLKNESRIYQHLSGIQGIPSAKWFGKDENNYYMVMNFYEKTTETLFSLDEVKKIGNKMISILRFIHRQGFVHRDVKPDNFIITPERQVYLIDFGLCKSYSFDNVERKTDGRIGSLNYMSRNAHKRMEIKPNDDLESLGYSLFHLFTGSLPWEKESDPEKILEIKEYFVKENTFLREYFERIL
jgi:serine/threonine protein kinase